MAPLLTEVRDIQLQLTTHLSPRRDERLSWPGWLTYSGRFTHIRGHRSPVHNRSSAGQGKFEGQRPTFYHCATQPTIMPSQTLSDSEGMKTSGPDQDQIGPDAAAQKRAYFSHHWCIVAYTHQSPQTKAPTLRYNQALLNTVTYETTTYIKLINIKLLAAKVCQSGLAP